MKINRSVGLSVPLALCLGTAALAQGASNPAPAITAHLVTSDVQVAADGSSTQSMHFEIVAGNDAAAQRIGQTSIPYDATSQEMTIVEAHTLKADGKTLPVDPSAIYDQAPANQSLMITGMRSKLIVFPQFAGGDTAVYTIKVETKHPNFPGQYVFGGLFVRTAAYDEVRETVTAPKSMALYLESHDVDASRHDDGANTVYSWHYSAPKALLQEPPTLMPLDHTPRFFISTFKDYAQLGRAYAALEEPKRVVTPKISALADEITAGTSDPKEQARKLYEWVSSRIRYVGIELGTGSFVPHDVDAIVANGYGDCKDHDVLLQALLKAKGIESESILINGSNNYAMTSVPTFTTLNHVITFVPRFNLYLDSSAMVAPFGILPLGEYGKSMVVATANSSGLGKMPVLEPGVAKFNVKTVAVLDKNGQISGTTTTTAEGPYAIALRGFGLAIQALGPAAAPNLMTRLGYRDALGSFTQDSPVGFAPEYSISGAFKASGWENNLSGRSSFVIPAGMRLFAASGDGLMGPFHPAVNMAPDEPTLCYSAEASEDLSLKAPDGYQFTATPKDVRVETRNLLFVAHWSLDGTTLSVHRDFTSKIDQPFCSGRVRTETAAALKQIGDSYSDPISFAVHDGKDGEAPAAAKGL